MAWGNEFNKSPAIPNPNLWHIGENTKELSRTIHNNISIRNYNNKVPTHDPYSNPDAHIYYQCNCGAVLDPGTKSFASLNNAAMNSGWKVRFGEEYYIPYCAECGKDVE